MKHRLVPVLAAVMIAVAAAHLGSALTVRAQTPPARFFGSINLNGAPAPEGTEVIASINDVECGRVRVTEAGRYVLDVSSSSTAAGCGEEGATVRFTVGGAAAEQTGIFQLGHFIALDLSAASDGAASPPPSDEPPAAEEPPPGDEQPPAEPPADAPPAEEPPAMEPAPEEPPAE